MSRIKQGQPATHETKADLPETLQSTTGDDAPAAELADEDTLCSACGCYDCGCDSDPNPAIEADDDVPDDPLAGLTDDQLGQADAIYAVFAQFMHLLAGSFNPEEWDEFEITILALPADDFDALVWREFAKRIERYAIVMRDTE